MKRQGLYVYLHLHLALLVYCIFMFDIIHYLISKSVEHGLTVPTPITLPRVFSKTDSVLYRGDAQECIFDSTSLRFFPSQYHSHFKKQNNVCTLTRVGEFREIPAFGLESPSTSYWYFPVLLSYHQGTYTMGCNFRIFFFRIFSADSPFLCVT